MIYWILHKKLTNADWKNAIEGNPCYFYEHISQLCFIDVSGYSAFAKIENYMLNINDKTDIESFGIDEKRFIRISNNKELRKLLLDSSPNDLFVFQSLADIRTKLLLAELNKHGKKTVLLNHWKTPIATAVPMKRNLSFVRSIFKKNPKLIFLRLLFRFYKLRDKKRLCLTYILSGGNKLTESIKKDFIIEHIVPVHSISYDEYLQVDKNIAESPIKKEPYFVFVDQALTIHPDNKDFSEKDTDNYRNELIKTLKYISEKNNGIKIVIAEHPRIRYEDNFWHGYERFSGISAQLIKYSNGVIGHFSTILALAQIYNKKIFLLKSSSFYFPFNSRVDNASKMLGSKLFDMKTLESFPLFHEDEKVNLTEYFSLCPNCEKSNNDLFMDFFKQFL